MLGQGVLASTLETYRKIWMRVTLTFLELVSVVPSLPFCANNAHLRSPMVFAMMPKNITVNIDIAPFDQRYISCFIPNAASTIRMSSSLCMNNLNWLNKRLPANDPVSPVPFKAYSQGAFVHKMSLLHFFCQLWFFTFFGLLITQATKFNLLSS